MKTTETAGASRPARHINDSGASPAMRFTFFILFASKAKGQCRVADIPPAGKLNPASRRASESATQGDGTIRFYGGQIDEPFFGFSPQHRRPSRTMTKECLRWRPVITCPMRSVSFFGLRHRLVIRDSSIRHLPGIISVNAPESRLLGTAERARIGRWITPARAW